MSYPTEPPRVLEKSNSNPLSPAVRGYPAVGVLPQLLRNPLQFTTRAVHDHAGIARVSLGPLEVTLVGRPDYAQHILRDRAANYTKAGGMWDALRLLGGEGLGTIDGAPWRKQRRMMQPLFQRPRLAGLPPLITACVDTCMPRWEAAARKRAPLDIVPELEQITMRVVLRTSFSTAINDAEIAEINAAISFALGHVGMRMWAASLPPWLPMPGHRRFRAALQLIDRIVYRIIEERRRKPEATDDLLALLLTTRDETTGAAMSDQRLRDELVGFYVAGYETVSNALSWTLYLLGRHPEVQSRLHEELDLVLAGRTPSFADLSQLTYTKMIFQEVLRLYPPAWIVPRCAQEEDLLGGYRIPAGAHIAILLYAIHRHPSHWNDPEAFKPERFSEGSTVRAPCAYLPFGAGARQCIGSSFALLEGPLVLAMLAQRFRLRLWPGHPVEPRGALALRPRHGVRVSLEARGVGHGRGTGS